MFLFTNAVLKWSGESNCAFIKLYIKNRLRPAPMQSLVRPRILFFGGSVTEGASADTLFELYPEPERWTSLLATRCKPIVVAAPQRSMLASGSLTRCINDFSRALDEHKTGLRAAVLELGSADLGNFNSPSEMVDAVNSLVEVASTRKIPIFFLAHCGADFERLGRLADSAELERGFLDAAESAVWNGPCWESENTKSHKFEHFGKFNRFESSGHARGGE